MAEPLTITYIPVSDIKPYKRNAKQHPAEQVAQIANSIREFGMNDPIAVDEDNVIIEGHGRLLAVQKLMKDGEYHEDTIPCIRLDGLTTQQKRAYILAHNKLTMNTGFDLDTLNAELSDIIDFDMSDFGFIDEAVTDAPEPDAEDDNYDAPVPAQTYVERGQIYRLGSHRLMCGDSTDIEDVKRLMNGDTADLFLTDPPYGVAIGDKYKMLNVVDNGGRIQENISNDTMSVPDISELWLKAFTNALAVAKDDCAFYISSAQGGELMMMMMMIQKAGWQLKHTLIWAKNVAVFSLGHLDYDYKHEPVLYGWNKRHNFYAKEYQTSLIKDLPLDVDALSEAECRKILKKVILNPERPVDVIEENKPRVSDLHPTMKPIPLFGRFIKNSTKPNDLVLDLFGGSGTTIIAAEQLNRNVNMMEYDPHYVQVIIDRWEKYTGQTAELIS